MLLWLVIRYDHNGRNELLLVMAETSEARNFDRLGDIAKLILVLWLFDGVHLGSSVRSFIDYAIKWVEDSFDCVD